MKIFDDLEPDSERWFTWQLALALLCGAVSKITFVFALVALVLSGCYEKNVESPTEPLPLPPNAPVLAAFQGIFTPSAAADDGVCRLLLVAQCSNGVPPYAFTWDAMTIARDANTALGYPSTGNVNFTFPATYGANTGNAEHLIQLVCADVDGDRSVAGAAEPFDCASQGGVRSFRGTS